MTIIKIPSEVIELMKMFHSGLREIHPDLYTGLYLHGSVCLEAYQSDISDIDFVVLLRREPTATENQDLEIFHNKFLNKTKLAKKLEGVYTTNNQIEYVSNETNNPIFLKIEDGRTVGVCDGRLGAVDLYLLKHKGISIYGESLTHHIQVSSLDLLWEMKWNIENYWQNKLQQPEIFTYDGWIEFGVSTISRIRYTLQFGDVISKLQAMDWILNLPEMEEEDCKVIQEAIEIRSMTGKSMYESRYERTKQVISFLNKQMDVCKDVLSKNDFN